MFEFIRNHQMNIMLCLCAACATMTVMLLLTKFLSSKRKWILVSQEVVATLLLFFDRLAYIYAGNQSSTGFIMIRLSNFMVFFLTSGIVLNLNFYLIDLLENEGKLSVIPRRLFVTGIISAIGMLVVIISAFTGFYYYFDSQNIYHRGPGFLFCYLVPVICPVIQYTSIFKYRKSISKFIFIAVTLYIFLPIIIGIIQILTYGLSIVNMALVLVSIFLYFFTYLDVNAAVEKAHKIEIQSFKQEQTSMKKIFAQTAIAFAKVNNNSERMAQLAREIGMRAGKNEEECDNIYYAAFLCDAGADALASITEYPYLSETAKYVGQPYSKDIPEYSRIITVAKAYDNMINNPDIPPFFVRDHFLREAGIKYDPAFSKLAVSILDDGTNSGLFAEDAAKMETELLCKAYRESVTTGIEASPYVTNISFNSVTLDKDKPFSAPSIILFDSYDKQIQTTTEAINANKYLEYGELWFDAHYISSGARNFEIRNVSETAHTEADSYKIVVCRFEDHLLIKMQSPQKSFDAIIALPSASKQAYVSITGENVCITNINVEQTQQKTQENDIPRIAEKLSFINRIESDIPNVQIVNPMGAFTKAVEIKDSLNLFFHTQSLPDANLIWHCPYIILFYSDDAKLFGKNYREFAMIKYDGETNESNKYADNTFIIKKTEAFKTWEEWEAQNKAGYESEIEFYRSGNEITLRTQNKGIYIQNTTKIKDGTKEIYVALSGDQVALTDIRIR